MSYFRLVTAACLGLYLIPYLLHLDAYFLSSAFRQPSQHVLPLWFTLPVSHSPDALVWWMSAVFAVSWVLFFIGWFTRAACIVLTLSCFYFTALNAFPMRTLAWHLMLLSLALLCFTRAAGDHFSIDAKRRSGKQPKRAGTVLRLLQLQLAWFYGYSGLSKIFPGNWLTDNPVYYLVNYPPEGPVKEFWGRPWLAASPDVCYGIGVMVVAGELLLCAGLLYKKTRVAAVAAGILFHVMVFLTLHVENLFFLYPPLSLLLFVPQKNWERLIRRV